MRKILAWWRWHAELRQARRDADTARRRSRIAYYTYIDVATVLGNAPGAWHDGGACAVAQQEALDRVNELTAATSRVRRLRELGPR